MSDVRPDSVRLQIAESWNFDCCDGHQGIKGAGCNMSGLVLRTQWLGEWTEPSERSTWFFVPFWHHVWQSSVGGSWVFRHRTFPGLPSLRRMQRGEHACSGKHGFSY